MGNREHLAALLGHLNSHPHLADTFGGANHTRHKLGIQVFPYHRDGDHLGAYAAWARTLTDLAPVVVRSVYKGQLHLDLYGKLADGTPVEVYCLPDEHESDLLAVQTPVHEKATFPVELLLRLVDHTTAEQVA